MAKTKEMIGIIGAGRMGRGIAQAFAFSGHRVVMVDFKDRSDEDRDRLRTDALNEIRTDLVFLASIGIGAKDAIEPALGRIEIHGRADAGDAIASCELIFEGVPETPEAKELAFSWVADWAHKDAVIASTTSTISVDELATMVTHPERFLNAHWLNPAALMPLVEIAKGEATSDAAVAKTTHLLEAIGKTPVVMANSPGYVVPRIQALAMNEAARLFEEGVASAEDIDKAIRLGFGIRYAILGMLEFIDFGGNDILFHASNYLSGTVDKGRYEAPAIVKDNMAAGRNGMRDGAGFFEWDKIDVPEYRKQRLTDFVGMLRFMDLLPKQD